jgi:FixJ family two-component response regulator
MVAVRKQDVAASAPRVQDEGRTMSQYPLIAIIDDDASMVAALSGLVRSLGYRAEGHGSAEAFVESLGREKPRCIVTDIQMPGMDGIALKQWLAARGCAIPVIMITARTEESLFARAHAAGALCLLHKPFAADRLIDCLAQAMALSGPAGAR